MANTGKIERAAVRAVEEYLDECPKLEPSISKADKNKIWDGVINIFEKEDQKISQFFAQVPLQVKGTTSANVINSFRLGRDYIDGYKKVGGTAFFLVQKGTGKVFYALLSVEDIDILLKQTTKTIKINLEEVPEDPKVFEKQLYAFAANRNIEKVEQTSPKEIQELVEGFEGLREHLKEIKDKSARMELESSLDFIKNLKDESAEEKGTIGWRDKFYYHSRKAIDIAINNIENFDFAGLQFKLGKYLQDQKQYHLTEDYYLKSLDDYRKRSDIADVAMTLNNLGELHRALTRYGEAEKECKEALKIYRELAKNNRDAYIGYVAGALNNLGNLHKNLTHYGEAEKEYKEALKIYRELAKNNRDAYIGYVAGTLNNLANLHKNLTHYGEAEKEFKEALEIRRELAEINNDEYIVNVAMILNNLGLLHNALTHYDEAEKEYNEALEIYRELAKTNRDAYIGDVAMTLNNLALLHDDLNRKDEAEIEYKEALEIRRKLAKNNRDAYIGYVAGTLNNLGNLHKNLTHYDEAEKEYKEALEIYRELAKTNSDAYIVNVAMTLNNLAILHKNLTRYKEAEKEYKEALEIRRKLAKNNRGAYIGYVAQTLYNIALLQKATDRKAESQKTAEEALGIFEELAEVYPQIWNSRVEKTDQLLKRLK